MRASARVDARARVDATGDLRAGAGLDFLAAAAPRHGLPMGFLDMVEPLTSFLLREL